MEDPPFEVPVVTLGVAEMELARLHFGGWSSCLKQDEVTGQAKNCVHNVKVRHVRTLG
jgi:hypothetical protein